jgi:hypothetical protein
MPRPSVFEIVKVFAQTTFRCVLLGFCRDVDEASFHLRYKSSSLGLRAQWLTKVITLHCHKMLGTKYPQFHSHFPGEQVAQT